MADSVREQVIAAVIEALGARYSLGSPFDDGDLPMTAVVDGNEDASTDVHGRVDVELPISVASGVVLSTSDPDELRRGCHELLAGLQQSMMNSAAITSIVDSIEYTGGGILPEPGGRCMAEATFTLRYHFSTEDPYTSG